MKSPLLTSTVLFTTSLVALASVAFYFYQKKRKGKIPSNWEEIATIKKIRLYPLKSGQRIELEEAECTPFGLKQVHKNGLFVMRDRSFVVYGERDGEFRTARTYPKMVLIKLSVENENEIMVDAPGMNTLRVIVPNKNDNKETNITLHKQEKIYSIDCGDDAARWFSKYILEKDHGLRLGYHDGSRRRDITKTHKKLLDYYTNLGNDSTGLYSDISSVHLINQKSVDDVVQKIENGDITVENFRPNIVIDGPNLEAFAEDDWDWLKIGDCVFRYVKDCTRCVFTTINPENAHKDSARQPLKTLERFRMSVGPDKLPIMGIHLETMVTGKIKMSDPVYVGKH